MFHHLHTAIRYSKVFHDYFGLVTFHHPRDNQQSTDLKKPFHNHQWEHDGQNLTRDAGEKRETSESVFFSKKTAVDW